MMQPLSVLLAAFAAVTALPGQAETGGSAKRTNPNHRCPGVGGGAGSAGWWGWLARSVIGARDGDSGAAAGLLRGSGLSRAWVSG